MPVMWKGEESMTTKNDWLMEILNKEYASPRLEQKTHIAILSHIGEVIEGKKRKYKKKKPGLWGDGWSREEIFIRNAVLDELKEDLGL